MKRDPALHPLSWNHQNGLSLAYQLNKALEQEEPDLEACRKLIRKHWEAQLKQHFLAEEEHLLPLVARETESFAAEIQRIREEHDRMRELVASILSGGEIPTIAEFAKLLHDHIRFEEREFFEGIQKAMSPKAFEQLGKVLKDAVPPNCPL